jgi:hypothetical protein
VSDTKALLFFFFFEWVGFLLLFLQVPHFVFYRNNEVVHEEQGIDEEQLQGDVLYYGDPDAPILQLHGRADFEALLQEHKADDKLLVIDVGLKNCGPCVKVKSTTHTPQLSSSSSSSSSSSLSYPPTHLPTYLPTYLSTHLPILWIDRLPICALFL